MLRLALPIAVTLAAISAGALAQGITSIRVGESEASFSLPHDVVLSPDGQLLYVADLGNNAVKAIDPLTLRTLGVFGHDELRAPHDVTFDAAGRLLVADSGNDRIVAYRVNGTGGTFIEEVAVGLASPEGVAVARDGTIYVTNARSHDVVAIKGGKRTARVGGSGGGPNQYDRPHDIAVAPDGRVYVVDAGNNRIQVLTPDLEFIEEIAGPPFDFNEPKYIAFDAHGWLYVADENNNQVKIFDSDRRPVEVIGTRTRGRGGGMFYQPEGVDVRGDRLWVADTYNDRIVHFRLEGLPETH